MIRHRFKANRPKITKPTNITPYWNVIEKIINESDILLEIIDARMPEISRNKKIESMTKESNKKLILVLNKSDLVSKISLRNSFKKLGKELPVFIVSNKKNIGTKRLREYIIKLSKTKQDFKVGVLGYPNTGKSSITNILAKRKKSIVTSKAGTTHGVQWISAKKFKILDSPGVIPLEQNDEVKLALIASKNVEKIKNHELVAHKIIKLFKKSKNLDKFYNIKTKDKNPDEIIDEIGKSKKFIKKGRETDEIRTSIQIIRDWQSGRLSLI